MLVSNSCLCIQAYHVNLFLSIYLVIPNALLRMIGPPWPRMLNTSSEPILFSRHEAVKLNDALRWRAYPFIAALEPLVPGVKPA